MHACVETLHPGEGCRNQRNQHRTGQRQRQSSKLLVAVVILQAAASPSPSQSSSQSPGRRQPHLPCTCSAWSTDPAKSQPGEDSAESGKERFARDNAGDPVIKYKGERGRESGAKKPQERWTGRHQGMEGTPANDDPLGQAHGHVVLSSTAPLDITASEEFGAQWAAYEVTWRSISFHIYDTVKQISSPVRWKELS